MSIKEGLKVPVNNITHSVRVSQAVLQYGVGAMVDFPDQTLMTAAPEYWKENVVKIVADVCADQSAALLKSFFKVRRLKKKE